MGVGYLGSSLKARKHLEPGAPGGAVLLFVRSPITRGDCGLQCASEANGMPERWSPPSPAVMFANHAPHQYTAETAGSSAHRKRTGSRNISLRIRRQCVGIKCGDEAYPTKRGDKVRGQRVSAKHPLNPTLKLTLKRNAYSTRLIFRSARAAQRFYPLNCEPLSGRNNRPSKKRPCALKGRDIPAQGNALGKGPKNDEP